MYILLVGYPPFKGKNHKEIFDKIKLGKYSLGYPEWKEVSKEAKYLIKKLLTYDPAERISSSKALGDVWITTNCK